jgi:hypothetical protein
MRAMVGHTGIFAAFIRMAMRRPTQAGPRMSWFHEDVPSAV